MKSLIAVILGVFAFSSHAGFESWPMLARDAARAGTSEVFAAPLSSPAWVAAVDESGNPIEFVGQSGPVVWRDLVYALGESGGSSRIFAFDRTDGTARFSAPIDSPSLDSWSTPAVDESNGTVIIASGNNLRAFDARTGDVAWTITLPRDIVNASPLVTDDLGPADRVFITGYDGFLTEGGGLLVCINADAFDESLNPFEPGEIVWSFNLGAVSSGNTPAYDAGVVYTADGGDPNTLTAGRIRGFDATSINEPPSPLWTFTNPIGTGFFGGVSVRDGHVFAGSFTFFGAQDSANLVKVNASNGDLVWSSPCNRTASLPILLSDGRVLLSTGLAGFGSLPALQLFAPDGTRLWDSALETAVDANNNEIIEIGEFFAVGGWTHVPTVVETALGAFVYTGTPPLSVDFFDAHTDVHLLDLEGSPSDAGFVVETYSGAGSTPALADGVLYTIGVNGLHAFGVFTGYEPADVNTDCAINSEDLYSWNAGIGRLDVNGDDSIDGADKDDLIRLLRADESAGTLGGVP